MPESSLTTLEPPAGMTRRDMLVYLAKLAEQGERYDEMADFMIIVGEIASDELNIEERNLLSVAFKNAVGARRASLRIIASLEQKHKRRKDNGSHILLTTKYREAIEKELEIRCAKVLELINNHLVPAQGASPESKVFLLKMKADYYRYLAEYAPADKTDQVEKARQAYDDATTVAEEHLSPTNPIRLGLSLNYSVFYFEILGNAQQACSLAQSAFDEAIRALDQCHEGHYRDSTLIMQLLRDNLTLWQSDAGVDMAEYPATANPVDAKQE